MARLFTADGTVNCTTKVAAQGFTAWGFGTLAVVIYVTNNVGADGRIVIGNDTQDFVELYSNATPNVNIQFYNGATSGSAATTYGLSRWLIQGVTKATGNVTPRAHGFDWTTGTWTHQNMGGNQVDAAGTGATQHGTYGDTAGSAGNAFDGHMLALAAWKSRVLTDSEVEQLARGLWDLRAPDLLLEFPSGRDHLTRTTIDCSRNRMLQVTRGSQVTRSNIVGPPGFRLSALNRRR